MTNVVNVNVFRDSAGEWRWHATAANGEIVAEGEAHTRPDDAERAAHGVFPEATLTRTEPLDADPGDEQPEASVSEPIPGLPVLDDEPIPGQMEVGE